MGQSGGGGRGDDILRRAADVVVSVVLLAALLPVLLAVAALVRLTSEGSVIFRQERVGQHGRLFRICKFRSMRHGEEGQEVTAGGDVRVTRFGRLLRRSKIDELPQLWNVLVGDMSLVGPRPEVPRYVSMYTAEQRNVLSVRPGITGPTQLLFAQEEDMLRDRADVEQYYLDAIMPVKLASDLAYIEHRSILGDLGHLGRTVGLIVGRASRTGEPGEPGAKE